MTICSFHVIKKIFVRILTANSLSPTARVQSLAAGLPGAKEATNTPLSSPIPLSEREDRKRIRLASKICITKYLIHEQTSKTDKALNY